MLEDHRFGNAGRPRDVFRSGAAETAVRKQIERCLKDLLAAFIAGHTSMPVVTAVKEIAVQIILQNKS